MDADRLEAVLHAARAGVLHDLHSRDVADAAVVSLLEDAVSQRRWWVEQWPDGADFVLGLIAQDVQDALLDSYGRWPLCGSCTSEGEPQALSVDPELGPDPRWVCEKEGLVIAPVGELGP
ncbi:hypothetical protein GXW83_03285 [Streptacidiphilus sp. PB12-B1b]|uniref:hypothetical protein n=1 Tax=Streptacidiphilus sp. PB12-B1b TaxID=2705012 RepID=UPI0015FCB063|nr:hypothetical protein [Streptacidiphilus sp. PB12-B1b]QMU74933.1 hypothetical protein GXW83_03285 [Streptacidiphilus sp. PB12-B1b]